MFLFLRRGRWHVQLQTSMGRTCQRRTAEILRDRALNHALAVVRHQNRDHFVGSWALDMFEHCGKKTQPLPWLSDHLPKCCYKLEFHSEISVIESPNSPGIHRGWRGTFDLKEDGNPSGSGPLQPGRKAEFTKVKTKIQGWGIATIFRSELEGWWLKPAKTWCENWFIPMFWLLATWKSVVIQFAMDWLQGISTGNHCFYDQTWGFPANLSLRY